MDRLFVEEELLSGGMGPGLSVAYGIIKDHQGWIDVETHLGEGTTLQYHFP